MLYIVSDLADLKSKTRKSFDAGLKLNENYGVTFDFFEKKGI